jgi:hypothetical protein
MSRLSARRWARAQSGTSKGPVAAALGGVFAAISNGSYRLDLEAQGCPGFDMSLGAKAFWRPRLHFWLSPVVDGQDAAAAEIDDEYLQVNSLSASDPSADFEGGESAPRCFSALRVPDTEHDDRLFAGHGAPADERFVVEPAAEAPLRRPAQPAPQAGKARKAQP